MTSLRRTDSEVVHLQFKGTITNRRADGGSAETWSSYCGDAVVIMLTRKPKKEGCWRVAALEVKRRFLKRNPAISSSTNGPDVNSAKLHA